ncbi:hypothetical protein Tco_0928065 [Tanacetum coccineum]
MVRPKRTWTKEEDEKLMDALLQLHVSGKYAADNGFKPGYKQDVETLLDASLLNSGLKAEPHIRFMPASQPGQWPAKTRKQVQRWGKRSQPGR